MVEIETRHRCITVTERIFDRVCLWSALVHRYRQRGKPMNTAFLLMAEYTPALLSPLTSFAAIIFRTDT